jgi:ABC-type transport system substrate-binding protein
VLSRVQTTFDDAGRAALVAETSEIAIADLGAIPVYYPVPLFGMRKGIVYDVSTPLHSFAANIHPARPVN